MKNRSVRIFIILAEAIILNSAAACFAEKMAQKSEPNWPSAKELLTRYGETQDKLKSCIIKSQDYQIMQNPVMKMQIKDQIEMEFRYDGKRYTEFHFRDSSNISEALPGRTTIAKKEGPYVQHLYDGQRCLTFTFNNGEIGKDLVVINLNKTNTSSYYEGSLIGFLNMDNKRIEEVLANQKNLQVLEKQDKVAEQECFILKANTDRGQYTLWISPEHDYHIVKAQILRKSGNKYGSDILPEGVEIAYSLEISNFKKIDDIWVPMEAKETFLQKQKNGASTKTEHTHIRTDVIINPDHKKLDSFGTSKIRNGTEVGITGTRNTNFTWQDGKVVDKDGKVIMDFTAKKGS